MNKTFIYTITRTLFFILLSLLSAACVPSAAAVQIASTQTQAAQPTATQTPTETAIPTPAATATVTPVPELPVISPENAAHVEELTPLDIKTGFAGQVAWSPGGKLLAVGGDVIHLYDAKTLGEKLVIKASSGGTLAFSPDELTLASVEYYGSGVDLWSTSSGELINRMGMGRESMQAVSLFFNNHGRTSSGPGPALEGVAFSPDGHMMAIGLKNDMVTLWDILNGKRLRDLGKNGPNLEGYGVSSLAFSPDGRTLAVGSDGIEVIRLFDVSSGGLRGTLEVDAIKHFIGSFKIAYSPDGRTIAAGGKDGRVKLWDTASNKLLRTLGEQGGSASCVAFSPDGRILAAAYDDGKIRLWDTANGQLLLVLSIQNTSYPTQLAFSPDGRRLVSVTADVTIPVRLWGVVR